MDDLAGGSFSQLHSGALAACGVQPAGCMMGSGSSSASVARYLTDSLSLLVLLVYLNLVRIRLLQYLSAKEIYPKSALNILAKKF